MIKDAESWAALHTYKPTHFNHRSKNIVEGSLVVIKHHVKCSSSSIKLVTDKIDQWFKRKVNNKSHYDYSIKILFTYCQLYIKE